MRKRVWPRWVRPWFRLENLHFLFEAGSQFSASLELDATIEKAAQILVPQLADWCIIDFQDRGSSRRMRIAHKDQSRADITKRLEQIPIQVGRAEGIAKTLGTAESQLFVDVSDEQLVRFSRDKEHYELIKELGCCSAVIVPMEVSGEMLGSLTLIISEPAKRYNQYDVFLFQEFARRIGLAIFNAKLYHKAQETVVLREEFISIASHEIRTPLTNLSLQLQLASKLLQEEDLARHKLAAMRVDKAQEQIGRLVRFMDELLEVSKFGIEEWPLSYERFDLCEVAKRAAKQLEELRSKYQSELLIESKGPVIGQWDPIRVEQVITNLLSNAFKYGQGKPISMTIFQSADLAKIWVKDNGMGIKEDEQEKIFQKFTRAAKEATADGSGLGLWLVKQIVEYLGGAISVKSKPNEGSLFEVVLPLNPKKL